MLATGGCALDLLLRCYTINSVGHHFFVHLFVLSVLLEPLVVLTRHCLPACMESNVCSEAAWEKVTHANAQHHISAIISLSFSASSFSLYWYRLPSACWRKRRNTAANGDSGIGFPVELASTVLRLERDVSSGGIVEQPDILLFLFLVSPRPKISRYYLPILSPCSKIYKLVYQLLLECSSATLPTWHVTKQHQQGSSSELITMGIKRIS